MGMAAVNTAMQAKIQETLCSFTLHPPLPLETPERAILVQSISTTCYRARNCQFRQSARSIAEQLPRGRTGWSPCNNGASDACPKPNSQREW